MNFTWNSLQTDF